MATPVLALKHTLARFCPVVFTSLLWRTLPGTRPAAARRMSLAGETLRPLEGVRVLDLTRVLAGPFATMILADLGAEVIKVERPGAGDDTRVWGPPFIGSESVYFLSINRNKKSIAVDLKHPRGVKIIKELAAVCDVLVENFIPGKLSQMSLGYEQLSRVNPRLIYCSISGYGQTGPQCQSPGYDSIASAVSGMMHITGPEGGEPVRPGVAMTDLATGLYAHGAVMAALLHRHKTGGGVHIDCNLLSSQVSCLSHIAANFLNAGKEAKRWGTAHESIVPYQGFRTRDGHVVVAAGNDKQFIKVCEVLQLTELTQQPHYKTNKLRVHNRQQLIHTLSQRFLQEKTADWLRRFEGSGVPVGPINSIQEVFSDPQVKHNNLIQEVKHPTAGRVSVPGCRDTDTEEVRGHRSVSPSFSQQTFKYRLCQRGIQRHLLVTLHVAFVKKTTVAFRHAHSGFQNKAHMDLHLLCDDVPLMKLKNHEFVLEESVKPWWSVLEEDADL